MKLSKKTKRGFIIYCVLVLTLFVTSAYAANDPLEVVNNLSDFIFGLIRAIGMILLGFGIVQIGLSLKSHDPSQRANGYHNRNHPAYQYDLQISCGHDCRIRL